jgi:hypothetical protein
MKFTIEQTGLSSSTFSRVERMISWLLNRRLFGAVGSDPHADARYFGNDTKMPDQAPNDKTHERCHEIMLTIPLVSARRLQKTGLIAHYKPLLSNQT